MDPIIDYAVIQFQRLFPDQAQYAPLIRQAFITRSSKVQAIMAFYLEKRPAELAKGKQDELDDMCLRATRAAVLDEMNRNSAQSSFMIKSFLVLNRGTVQDMFRAALLSEEVATLLRDYPYLAPLVAELSTQEWCTSH